MVQDSLVRPYLDSVHNPTEQDFVHACSVLDMVWRGRPSRQQLLLFQQLLMIL
jgi:hypothetical protein